MLTFFRRIRKGLLGEGAVPKYLLYAIGEILLVMIGILLALQVNNWNQKKLNDKGEKEILNRIIQDLELDVIDIKDFSRSNEIRMLKIVWVLSEFGHENDFHEWKAYQIALQNFPDINELLSSSIGETIMSIRYYRQFEESKITIQEIMSTGKLDIIKNHQIKSEIQFYYTEVERAGELQRLLIKNRDELVNYLLSQNLSMANKLNKEELIKRLKTPERLIAHLENFMFSTNITSHTIFIDENSVKNRTQKLIASIRAYLEQSN